MLIKFNNNVLLSDILRWFRKKNYSRQYILFNSSTKKNRFGNTITHHNAFLQERVVGKVIHEYIFTINYLSTKQLKFVCNKLWALIQKSQIVWKMWLSNWNWAGIDVYLNKGEAQKVKIVYIL